MILAPQKNDDLLATIVEFSYAEYGSALEMLAAAKKTKSSKLKLGYIRHALDEYRHTSLLHKVLDDLIKKGKGEFKKEYKFNPQNVVMKGYIDKDGFLVEKLRLKKFVEFVYANEFLAKQSFQHLSKRVKDIESSKIIKMIIDEEQNHADSSVDTLNSIMKEEDVHHGMAKKFYENKFPEAHLQLAFKREKMKNKLRMFYVSNLRFLNKIFDPIINFTIRIFGKIVNFIEIPKNNKNLMASKSSVV